jgi:hypothetical protein
MEYRTKLLPQLRWQRTQDGSGSFSRAARGETTFDPAGTRLQGIFPTETQVIRGVFRSTGVRVQPFT